MFQISAELVLRSPQNIKPILNNIRSQLNSLPVVQINAKVSPTTQAEINKLTTSLNRLQTTAVATATAVRTISPGQGLSNVTSHFNTATRSSQNFANSIENAGRRMMAYASFSAPMLASLKALHSAYASFNEIQQISVNLAQVNSVGLTDALVKRMENQVRRITSSHGSNTKDVYNAVANLSQAGISEKQISSSVGTLSSLSMNKQVENFRDVSDAYILLSSSFKMNSPQIEKAFSMMVHNSKITASEFSGLLEALKRGGSVFQTTGQDLNTLVATFSYLREKTRLEPEVVQTGLNSAVSSLFADKRITELMRTKLGVDVFTATGNVRNLIDVLEELGGKLKGLPKEQSLPLIKEFFGKKQSKVGTALLENIEDGRLRQIYNIALKNSNDIMKDQAVAAESLQGKLNKVRNEWAMASSEIIHSKSFTSATENILGMTSSLVRLATTMSQLIPTFAQLGASVALVSMGSFAKGGIFPGGKQPGFTDVWKQEADIKRQIKMRQAGNVPMMLDKDVPSNYQTGDPSVQWYRDNSARAKIGRLNQRGGYALSGGMALAGQFMSGAMPDSPGAQGIGTGMTTMGGMMMMGITNPFVLAIGTAVTSLTAWNNALEDSARKLALNMGAESLRKYNMSGDRTSPDTVKLLYDAITQQKKGIIQSGEQPGFVSTLLGGLGKAFSGSGASWNVTADTIANERKQDVKVRSSDVYAPIINYEIDRLANKSKSLKEFDAKPETKQLMDFASVLGMNTQELREAGKKIIDLKNAVQKKQEMIIHLDDVKQKIFAGTADILDKTQSMNKVRNINTSRVPVSEGLQNWGTREATKSLKRLNVDDSTLDINRVLGALPKIRGGDYGTSKTSEEALIKSSKVEEIQSVIKAIIDSTDGLESQIKAIESAFAERVVAINKVGEQVDKNYALNMENLMSIYSHKAEIQGGRLNISRSNIGLAEMKQSYAEVPGVPLAGFGNRAIQSAVGGQSVKDISEQMTKAFNAFKTTGDDKYKVVFDNLGKNLQLLGNSQERLRGEIEKLNYFEKSKQAKLGFVEQWTTSDWQGKMELGRGVGLAKEAVNANDLTKFAPMDQARIINVLGSALKDIPNLFGTNKTGENLKNDLLKTLPGVAAFVGKEQNGIDNSKKTIESVMTDSLSAQKSLQDQEEQMFISLTTRMDFNNSKFLAGLSNMFMMGMPQAPVDPVGKATGGYIRARYNSGGIASSDTVPAWLTPGEFVIKKSAVDAIGVNTLEELNSQGYADGGVALPLNIKSKAHNFNRTSFMTNRKQWTQRFQDSKDNDPFSPGNMRKSIDRNDIIEGLDNIQRFAKTNLRYEGFPENKRNITVSNADTLFNKALYWMRYGGKYKPAAVNTMNQLNNGSDIGVYDNKINAQTLLHELGHNISDRNVREKGPEQGGTKTFPNNWQPELKKKSLNYAIMPKYYDDPHEAFAEIYSVKQKSKDFQKWWASQRERLGATNEPVKGYAKGGRIDAQSYNKMMNDRRANYATSRNEKQLSYSQTQSSLREQEKAFSDSYKTRNANAKSEKFAKLVEIRDTAMDEGKMGMVDRLNKQISTRNNTFFNVPRVGEPISLFNQRPIKRMSANALTSGKPDESPINRINRIHQSVVSNKASLEDNNKFNDSFNSSFVTSMSNSMKFKEPINLFFNTQKTQQNLSNRAAAYGGLTQRPGGESDEQRKERIHSAVVANRGYNKGGLVSPTIRGYAAGGSVGSTNRPNTSGLDSFSSNFETQVNKLAQLKFNIPETIKFESAPITHNHVVTGESALAVAIVGAVKEYINSVVDGQIRKSINQDTGETKPLGPSRVIGG